MSEWKPSDKEFNVTPINTDVERYVFDLHCYNLSND